MLIAPRVKGTSCPWACFSEKIRNFCLNMPLFSPCAWGALGLGVGVASPAQVAEGHSLPPLACMLAGVCVCVYTLMCMLGLLLGYFVFALYLFIDAY